MSNQNISWRDAEALTAIGFENKFLSSENFSHIAPLEKICLVTKIINKKLELGRWENVVDTMYGEQKNVNQLYGEDEKELEKKIVQSSTQGSTYMKTEAVKILKKAKKDNVVFELAFNIPNLHYGEFMDIIKSVDSDFFADAQEGEQRKQRLNQTAADLAMQEEKYNDAFYHFSEVGDNKNINHIFEIVLKHKVEYDDERLLQKIALSNETQKDSRLKKIILKAASGEFNPLTAFALYQENNIQLSNIEEETLQKEVAKNARRQDITNTFPNHPEIKLLWAKKNAKNEPKTAYKILTEQEYGGKEVIMAVQAGLNLNTFQHKEKAIDISEISEPHLKEAYSSVPLNTKAKITHHLLAGAAATEPESALHYLKELKKLSRQAKKEGKLELAYDLWIEGGGKLNGQHINEIRTAAIKDCIENHYGIIGFLHSSDRRGKIEAYNTLIETGHLEKAYEIALELRGKRLDQIHEKMVASNPRWATDVFARKKDEKGLAYLTKNIASEYGISSKKLRTLINQYQTD